MVASGEPSAVWSGKDPAATRAATLAAGSDTAWTVRPIDGLYGLLQRAVEEASRRGEPLLAGWVSEIPAQEPLELFDRARVLGGVRLFWSDPLGQDGEGPITLVGAGAVGHLRGQGAARFQAIRQGWEGLAGRTLVDGQGVRGTGPLLMGGFAFDPAERLEATPAGTGLQPGLLLTQDGPGGTDSPGSERWHGFPDGLLTVPEVLVTSHGGRSWLSLNALVRPGHSAEALAGSLAVRAATLLSGEAWEQGTGPVDRAPGQEGAPGEPLAADPVDPEPWMKAVASAARAVREGRLRKVVLARPLRVRRPGGFEIPRVLASLEAANPRATLFALELGEATFLGATPERLARVEGGWVESMALAGSAPRDEDPHQDQRLGRELLKSSKNREEHQVVVDAVREALASLTVELDVGHGPCLLRLPTVQHLLTPVRGRLAPGAGLLDVVERLHPTPAVGGWPRQEALGLVRELEGWDRGWYAGPVGWIDPMGNGAFAVAIRSGLLRGNEVHLFAGCGIVGASEPRAEYEEWQLKLRSLLNALEEAAR